MFYSLLFSLVVLVRTTLADHNHHSWNCTRKWPSLALFLPFVTVNNVKDKRYYEVELTFLRSLTFFWPLKLSNTSLILAYDQEHENSSHIKSMNATVESSTGKFPGGLQLLGIPKYPYYTRGYDRQQYNMFWADNFTSSEFIGFMDSDVAITTYVDREDIWEDGKPVANCRSGFFPPTVHFDHIRYWTASTFRILNIKEPFYCMSYFPVVVKTSHLALMREHITKLHNRTSFDQVFLEVILADGHYQFGIMMTYLWAFHKDEYTW
jgi:hypothetical protein